jgi:hypothetical protein
VARGLPPLPRHHPGAAAICFRQGALRAVVEQPLYTQGIEALRARLGAAAFDHLWYAEDVPSLDDAIAEALEMVDDPVERVTS